MAGQLAMTVVFIPYIQLKKEVQDTLNWQQVIPLTRLEYFHVSLQKTDFVKPCTRMSSQNTCAESVSLFT